MANKSKIQQMKNGQMLITVPRAIGEAMRLKKGDEIEWLHISGDFIVRKI